MSYIITVATRWTKSVKFILSIAVHMGVLAKNHFWPVATRKNRIGEQLNYFWNICPKPFYGKKIKENFFTVGKTRGPLLARAALKRAFNDFFAFFFCLCCPYCCCFSLYRGEGIILRFFPFIIIPFGLFRRFFNALLNTSVFICRLLDTAENTMIPMIFVFMLNSSCYMM